MYLKLVSDGNREGTKILNGETGESLKGVQSIYYYKRENKSGELTITVVYPDADINFLGIEFHAKSNENRDSESIVVFKEHDHPAGDLGLTEYSFSIDSMLNGEMMLATKIQSKAERDANENQTSYTF